MPFKPGDPNINRGGRPPKGRALTEILNKAGSKGKNKLLASLLWEFATTGAVKLGDKTYKAADIGEWLQAVKFIYQHIDGGAPQAVEVSGPEGGAITYNVTFGGEGQEGEGGDT